MLAALCTAGCLDGGGPSDQEPAASTRIQQLEDQVAEQGRLLAQKDEQLREQAEIIQQLRKYPENKGLDDLIHVDRIEIERLSGGYDDDGDGIADGVAVYIRLFDQYGDTIKATGSARVKLLDLDSPPEKQLLGQIELDREELLSKWYGRLLTSHYSLKVPWSDGGAMTVVATFLEALSGRDFQAQRVVAVNRE